MFRQRWGRVRLPDKLTPLKGTIKHYGTFGLQWHPIIETDCLERPCLISNPGEKRCLAVSNRLRNKQTA